MAFLVPFVGPITSFFGPAAGAAATYVSTTQAVAALVTAITPVVVTVPVKQDRLELLF